jgi:hypothetical protein
VAITRSIYRSRSTLTASIVGRSARWLTLG